MNGEAVRSGRKEASNRNNASVPFVVSFVLFRSRPRFSAGKFLRVKLAFSEMNVLSS